MPKWNCRLVEVNGAEDPSAWYSITAANSKVAEFYGESGTRRIEVVAADVLRFFASE